MGRENIITIQVDNYNPFCSKNPNYNKTSSSQCKRKYIILNRIGKIIHLYILPYDYEIDLNKTVFKTLLNGIKRKKKSTCAKFFPYLKILDENRRVATSMYFVLLALRSM